MKSTLIIFLCLMSAAAYAQNPLALVGQYDGEAAEDHFGVTMTCGDFNGDGYDEFIIGATGWNGHTGKSYIYPGGVEFPTQAAWMIQGQGADEGYVVLANVGDVTGDGIEDFAAGANTWGTNWENARLNLYFGGNTLDTLPDWTFNSLYHYDVNSWDVDSCGDVNGDGGLDFIARIGTAGTDTNRIYIFWGGSALDTIPDWQILTYLLGADIDGLSDVNGDGFSDIMVRNYQGPALIYFGGSPMDTLPDVVFDDGHISDWIGTGVRDVNGDGINDAAFCWVFPDTIMPYDVVHFGGPLMNTIPDAWLLKWNGDTSRSLWEMSCGDFNGDGLGDIIGTTGYGAGTRGVQIHLGSGNFNTTPDAYVTGPSLYEFGGNVAAGDINGDEREELIISELNYPWFNQGRVFLYQGPPQWTDYGVGIAPPNRSLEIPEAFELQQNFPNPFNNETRITFLLQKASPVNVAVFNLQGKLIKNIINIPYLQPGIHYCQWDATDYKEVRMSAGVYLLRIETVNATQSIKMVLLP